MDSGSQARVERFRHTPFVCGHLGPDAGGHWQTLLAAAPVEVKVRSTGRLHAFAASRAPGLERVRGRRAWVWGRHLFGTAVPASWQEAQADLALAGFWVGDGEVRVHTDGLGQVELYARVLDGTTYVANRVEPLTRLGAAPLHTDWDAWGEHLLTGGFVQDHTAFREVRRLQFAESRVLRGTTVVRSRDLPGWMQADSVTATPADVLDAVLAQMPPHGWQEESAIGLSGGWDSRFIAVLLAHRGVRPPSAWSSHKDNGLLDDVEMAAAVASALGLEHHVVAPDGPRYWRRFREPTLRRLEHEVVLHTWLAPTYKQVRRLGVPVWDGLHGDLILRSAGVNQEVLWSGPLSAQREAQWLRIGGSRLTRMGALRPDLTRRWHDEARSAYYRGARPLEGLRAELPLRSTTSKGIRIIGASPGRLLAPEVPILLPFGAPEVWVAATGVPAAKKAGTSWYRDLIAMLDPQVAELPSTNDGLEPIRTGRPPGQVRPKLLADITRRIHADEVVRSIFTPRAQQHLSQGRALGSTGVSLEVVQWAEVLVSWRDRHRERLVADRPDGP